MCTGAITYLHALDTGRSRRKEGKQTGRKGQGRLRTSRLGRNRWESDKTATSTAATTATATTTTAAAAASGRGPPYLFYSAQQHHGHTDVPLTFANHATTDCQPLSRLKGDRCNHRLNQTKNTP
ncbi:hypothetical protein ElyMa_006457700 [Elysia marginata]|uniref:Uncharacterized protein n=1 Tax=Elysia marginata TaxID=1093978 RepID=A0AAV4HZ18_9GAST|nr:hypothetical protein ElyMa_006457700 [Elysia marginata]